MAKIFITGSSDGLGLLSAKTLIANGNQVVLHARNKEKAKLTREAAPGAKDVLIGDLASMEEIKQLANNANELGAFDVIIHNAGVYNVARDARSKDGLPLAFAVNSIAAYLLTALMHPPKRMIYLSSGMHRQGNADEASLTAIADGKNIPGYSDTKLHDLILAFAIARKWPETISNAVDPGWVPTRMGGQGAPDDLEQGYATQVWLATGTEKAATLSGRYLHHKKEMDYHLQAASIQIQEKFLALCEKITGVPFSRKGMQ